MTASFRFSKTRQNVPFGGIFKQLLSIQNVKVTYIAMLNEILWPSNTGILDWKIGWVTLVLSTFSLLDIWRVGGGAGENGADGAFIYLLLSPVIPDLRVGGQCVWSGRSSIGLREKTVHYGRKEKKNHSCSCVHADDIFFLVTTNHLYCVVDYCSRSRIDNKEMNTRDMK